MLDLDCDELYKLSVTEPDTVWDHFAQDLVWSKPYTSVIEDKESAFPKWFVGGEINMCYNCLDGQVDEGYGNNVAVIYDSPMRNIIQKFTYQELLDRVSLLAGVFVQKCGITKKDRVFIYLPGTPEALIAILACTRIGALYATTYAEYAPKEIADRIKLFRPKLIVTSNTSRVSNTLINFKKNIDDAIQFANYQPQFCLVYNYPYYEPANVIPNRDLDWSNEILNATPEGVVPVRSNHPLSICYTSGTTGVPKGLVIETGGAAVANKYMTKYWFGMKPNEAVFTMSSFSWIVGQLLSYACLLSRNIYVLYEGEASDRKNCLEILRILREHKVVNFASQPMMMKIFRRYCHDEDFKVEFKDLKFICLTGELIDPAIENWIEKTFNCPAYSIWGQTELGGITYGPSFSLNRSLQKKPENMIHGVVGIIVDKVSGKKLPNGSRGRLLLKLPLSPTRATTIYGNDELFYNLYFKKYPGYYDTMDSAMIMTDGTMRILSRDDNDIMVCGERINGAKVEEALLLDENLDAVCVIALEDPIAGFVPFGFLVPRPNQSVSNGQIIETAIKNVAENIGEIACFRKAVVVPELPKTKMGKTLQTSLEIMANGKEFKVHSLLNNRDVYSVIYKILLDSGYSPWLPS